MKEEALINAVIEIEALMMMAAQAANDRSEQRREVPSEVEDPHQTKEQRIDEAFNCSDTYDDSSQRSIGLTDLERFGAEDAFLESPRQLLPLDLPATQLPISLDKLASGGTRHSRSYS